jgi:hypothetical protein
MKKTTKVLLFSVLILTVVSISYLVATNTSLRTSILYENTGYPINYYPPGSSPPVSPLAPGPLVQAELIASETGFTDNLLTHIGFQLTNPRSTPVEIYSVAFKYTLPASFVVEGPLQLYGNFPAPSFNVNSSSGEIEFAAAASLGAPLTLAPNGSAGDTKAIFTVPVRPQTGVTDIMMMNMSVDLVQVQAEPSVQTTAGIVAPLAIDMTNSHQLSIWIYGPDYFGFDLNRDGKIDSLDVQEIFNVWKP